MKQIKLLHHRQRGMGFTGWFFIIGTIAFFTLLGVRLFPLYNEKFVVLSSMDMVAQRDDALELNPRQAREFLLKNINVSLNRPTLNSQTIKDAFKLEKDKKSKKTYMHVTYMATNKFFKDVNLMIAFDHKVEMGASGE